MFLAEVAQVCGESCDVTTFRGQFELVISLVEVDGGEELRSHQPGLQVVDGRYWPMLPLDGRVDGAGIDAQGTCVKSSFFMLLRTINVKWA